MELLHLPEPSASFLLHQLVGGLSQQMSHRDVRPQRETFSATSPPYVSENSFHTCLDGRRVILLGVAPPIDSPEHSLETEG